MVEAILCMLCCQSARRHDGNRQSSWVPYVCPGCGARPICIWRQFDVSSRPVKVVYNAVHPITNILATLRVGNRFQFLTDTFNKQLQVLFIPYTKSLTNRPLSKYLVLHLLDKMFYKLFRNQLIFACLLFYLN